MKTIKWGIIGCGDVTEVKSGPAFKKANGSDLVAVMRRNAEKAEDYAQRHQVKKWYNDADTLINDPDVDAVYIATPPDTHAFYTIKVAAAGKPVYVEKPMGRNYEECEQMINACKEAKVPLFVAYYRRALPVFLKVKDLINSGKIGKVRVVSLRLFQGFFPDKENLPWRVQPEISGGGLFHDLGSHQIDLLDFLFGPIKTVYGISKNQQNIYPAEDAIVASFAFHGNILGTGTWCFSSRVEERTDTVEIVGEEGIINFSIFAEAPIILKNNFGNQEYFLPYPENIQFPLIQSIVSELLGNGVCESTGVSAARTNKIIDKILMQ